ncbi:hypothetical protein GGR54DRAFT_120164 [Hypoxylon sp. NC1633]|nr:hypothetical protein GGR54DRAFT_120164 [Hypoxylon sp. NC1633]
MCWPYTLIYSCWDCVMEDQPVVSSCILVEPDAEDPVVRGYNHEGWLCPMRFLGSDTSQRVITPITCPGLRKDSRPFARLPGPNTFSKQGDGQTYVFSSPQFHFWICPKHRQKYIGLGPAFSGYKQAVRTELVEAERRAIERENAMLRKEARKEAAAREEGNGRQKQERWSQIFKTVSECPRKKQKKRKHGSRSVVEQGEATPTSAATGFLPGMARGSNTGPLLRPSKRQRFLDELDLP